METFVLTNNVASLKFVEVNGRQFAIAPITILRSRVLEGSRGPLYYPVSENQKHQDEWNGRPLVATTHPKANSGQNISANTPEIFQKQEIGRFYNSIVDNNGTNTGEGWFDVELTKKHDSRIWNALVNHQRIEVSTGLRNDFEEAAQNSAYDGVPYTHIARNYKPDHIAILADERGACSIKDGCGVNNSSGKTEETVNDKKNYPETCPHCNTKLEIDPDSGICNSLRNFNTCSRCGKKVEPISTNNQSSNLMNEKTNMISWLTTNCACLKGKDTQLTALTDNALKETILENAEKAIENDADASFMSWISNADKDIRGAITGMLKNKFKSAMGGFKPADPTQAPPVQPVVPTPDPNATAADELKRKQALAQQTGNSQQQQAPTFTMEQFSQMLLQVPFMKDLVANHQANQNTEKQQLIGRITLPITDNAAKQQAVTALSSKSVDDLRLIASLTVPVQQQTQNQGNQPNIPFGQPIASFFGSTGITDNQDNGYLQKEQLVTTNVDWKEWAKDAA